ncbi:PIG-L deacetylase family protein [Kineococcus esterisolvens]|uniref:PIG-L deacetylase family protein n=1 Tax=unclassified Kineococcus TaxID=2621656 RepID=UPI003D7E6C8B
MERTGGERFVLVSFHAHPDDEALLTGGTLARAAAEGHRVVLVVATDGAAGLSDGPGGRQLAQRRARELERSARALGVARVVRLGHRDSGYAAPVEDRADDRADGPVFSRLPVERVAAELAQVLRQEGADVLTSYDARGGYGHPDHVHVHRCGAAAAALAGTPVVLEATVDRTLVRAALRVVGLLPGVVGEVTARRVGEGFTARQEITHRVDVRAHTAAKRAALTAHASQSETGGVRGVRGIGLLLLLPRPLFRRLLGREWFVERGRAPGGRPLDDVFAGVRGR